MDERASLITHLEELRKRIIFSLSWVVLFSVLSYGWAGPIINFIAEPAGKLIFIAPQEVFMAYMKVAFFCGILLASPAIFYNVWRFVSIALKERERGFFLAFWIFTSLFFAGGAAFCAIIVIPVAVKLLLGLASSKMVPMITVGNYVNFTGILIIMFGIIFELPLLISLLTRLGIVTPTMLSSKRKYAVVFIFIAAGVLTPPDVVTQLLMAFPLLVLYEIGIVFSRIFYRPKDADYIKAE